VDGFLLVGGGTTTYPKATPPRVPVINVFDQWTAPSTPPNISANYRVWEVAGSSHVDMWIDRQEFDDPQGQVVPGAGQRSPAWRAQEEQLAGNYGASYDVRENSCVPGGNLFPDRYVMDNALVWLDRWVRTGAQPPTVPMLKFGNVTTSTPLGSPPGWDPAGTESTDQYGNALGGYRLPPITVPVASYVPVTCLFFGETIPFSPAVLRSLYPTHADYVRDMQIATDNALKAGLILPWDASDLMARAKASKIPDLSLTSPLPPSAS
ncbi:MAG TPA: alpha/beta hydrolase domain-containing protein, partial [Acidimicrobiales bacterium]|nr:alpha/beta hydrolase domain-containing protein [Acidimicrobiales bacterium]